MRSRQARYEPNDALTERTPWSCVVTQLRPRTRREGQVCVTLVLDSGALVALERNERSMWTRLKAAQEDGEVPITHAGVIGQVWRGGPRQARLSRALAAIDVRAVEEPLGRAAGELLGTTGLFDVIDAAVTLLAMDGDEIVTVDRDDFERLVVGSGRHVELDPPLIAAVWISRERSLGAGCSR